MKKIFSIAILCGAFTAAAYAQTYISGPMAVYGAQYNSATTLAANGSILVGSGGNWFFAGKISSVDKTTLKAPSTIGRTEQVTFSGSGKYSGIALIDGYASTTGKTAAFVLPIGNSISPYPVTVPAGVSFSAAYFDGTGSKTIMLNGATTTIYSPYIDMPVGITAGSYTFSYPSGFKSTTSSMLLSGNSTSGIYNVLTNVATFQPSAGATSANLSTVSTTQTYFGSSNAILPVNILSFTGLANNCTANLAWQTASESNSDYYAIETSLDGNNFEQVGKVVSKNNSAGAAYNYDYDKLISSITYFRLKAVDNDGKFTYSQVVAITGTSACNAGMIVKVWPNPTSDKVNIQGVSNGSRITLANLNGQKLTEVVVDGTNQTISLSGYAAGVYVLVIIGVDGSINSVKVVKNQW